MKPSRSIWKLSLLAALWSALVACQGRGGPSTALTPTTPTATPQPTTGPQLTINNNPASEYVASFTAADGAVLDIWNASESATGGAAFRIRDAKGLTAAIQIDAQGRPVFLEDSAGTKLWISNYGPDGEVDATLVNRLGESWRGVLKIPGLAESSPIGGRTIFRRGATPNALLNDLLQFGSRSCSTVTEVIGLMTDLYCYYGTWAAMVAAPPAGAIALLTCAGKGIVEDLVYGAFCALLSKAAEAVNAPNTRTIPIGNSPNPVPSRPTIPVTSYPAPTARDDFFSARRGELLQVPAPGVLANDSVPAGVIVDAEFVDFPNTISLTNTKGGGFTVDLSKTPQLTGQLRMGYLVFVGPQRSSARATVTITIQ